MTSIAERVLNPELYRRLVWYYGDVDVVSDGYAVNWRIERRAGRDGKLRARRVVDDSGEEYRVRCKICKDHRARLHINHRWGVWDPDTQSRNLFLANCFNEGCYQSGSNQLRLYETLFRANLNARVHMPIREGRPADPDTLLGVRLPGDVVRLDQLAVEQPTHHALLYLAGRGLDPVWLGRRWGVGYCAESRFQLAADRIIFPIHQDGVLAGWQARYIGDNVNGLSFNAARVPKYWSCPHSKRKLIAYNLEQALRHRTVVVVEGPLDVVGVGPQALGALGKSLSTFLRARIARAMRDPGKVLVVALDPEQDEKSAAEGKPHHLDKLVGQMRQEMPGRVVPLWLPDGLDPDKLGSPARFRELARAAAAELGLTLDFTRPR